MLILVMILFLIFQISNLTQKDRFWKILFWAPSCGEIWNWNLTYLSRPEVDLHHCLAPSPPLAIPQAAFSRQPVGLYSLILLVWCSWSDGKRPRGHAHRDQTPPSPCNSCFETLKLNYVGDTCNSALFTLDNADLVLSFSTFIKKIVCNWRTQ